MKYNQPYGMPAETTLYSVPYINGDPTIGQQGSIPPAASVEHDQREIVAVIQHAFDKGYKDQNNNPCAAPSAADLTQLLKAIFGLINSTRLQAHATYYVGPGGNDSNDGLTTGTRFLTLQRAATAATQYNLNGFNVTVNVLAGTYAKVRLPPVNGSGTIFFIGDTTTPSNCTIAATVGAAVLSEGANYVFRGFRYTSAATDGPGGVPGCAVRAHPGCSISVDVHNDFGACADTHIDCHGGVIAVQGTVRVTGATGSHIHSHDRGYILTTGSPAPNVVIVGGPLAIGNWVNCNGVSMAQVAYSGYSMTGAGITGVKANVSTNSVIGTLGAGTAAWPGTGTTVATGGQLV